MKKKESAEGYSNWKVDWRNGNNEFTTTALRRIFFFIFKIYALYRPVWNIIKQIHGRVVCCAIGSIRSLWFPLYHFKNKLRLSFMDSMESSHSDICFGLKNKTNYPMSNNSLPSATTKKAKHCLKYEGGGGGLGEPKQQNPSFLSFFVKVKDLSREFGSFHNHVVHIANSARW